MSYSIQLYTLRNALQEDLPGTIKKVAQLGFTQVEPYNFVATAAELGAALKENGLTAPSGHAPLLSQDQDEIFAAAKELGISTVIDPHVPTEHWQTTEDIKDTAAKLNARGQEGAGYGIRVGYHNHALELESRIDGQTALEYFAGTSGPRASSWKWTPTGRPSAARTRCSCSQRLGDRVGSSTSRTAPSTTDDQGQLAGRARADAHLGHHRRGRVPRSRRRGTRRLQWRHLRRRRRQLRLSAEPGAKAQSVNA